MQKKSFDPTLLLMKEIKLFQTNFKIKFHFEVSKILFILVVGSMFYVFRFCTVIHPHFIQCRFNRNVVTTETQFTISDSLQLG